MSSSIPTVIALALMSLFAASGLLHLAAPGFLRRAYERWNFPPRFYRVTALAELLAAAFLANPLTRIWGVVLAGLITFVAVATLLNHRQYAYSIPGMLVLVALIPATLAGPF